MGQYSTNNAESKSSGKSVIVIPTEWFGNPKLCFANGNQYHLAGYILADIRYWYKPTIETREDGTVRTKNKFYGDMLHKRYSEWASKFNTSIREVERAMKHLKEVGLVKVHKKPLRKGGKYLHNAAHIEIIQEAVDALSHTDTDGGTVKNGATDVLHQTHTDGGTVITKLTHVQHQPDIHDGMVSDQTDIHGGLVGDQTATCGGTYTENTLEITENSSLKEFSVIDTTSKLLHPASKNFEMTAVIANTAPQFAITHSTQAEAFSLEPKTGNDSHLTHSESVTPSQDAEEDFFQDEKILSPSTQNNSGGTDTPETAENGLEGPQRLKKGHCSFELETPSLSQDEKKRRGYESPQTNKEDSPRRVFTNNNEIDVREECNMNDKIRAKYAYLLGKANTDAINKALQDHETLNRTEGELNLFWKGFQAEMPWSQPGSVPGIQLKLYWDFYVERGKEAKAREALRQARDKMYLANLEAFKKYRESSGEGPIQCDCGETSGVIGNPVQLGQVKCVCHHWTPENQSGKCGFSTVIDFELPEAAADTTNAS